MYSNIWARMLDQNIVGVAVGRSRLYYAFIPNYS